MEASFRRLPAATLLLLLLHSSAAAKPQTPAPPNTDFIKTACHVTLYPRLCHNSLSPYADLIKTDPRLLARTALNVSLGSARSTLRVMEKLSRVHGMTPREAAAVADCVEVVAESVDELRMSVVELGRVGRSQMGDIQTWVSAALTDEDTCMEGFAGKAVDGRVKRVVRWRILKISHLTSNALALVNSYATP